MFPFNAIAYALELERRHRLRGPLGKAATRIIAMTPWLYRHERAQVAHQVTMTLRIVFIWGVLAGAGLLLAFQIIVRAVLNG